MDHPQINRSCLVVSDEERLAGALSPENLRMATLLLECNGFVRLQRALDPAFVGRMQAEFRRIMDDCLDSVDGHSADDIPWSSKQRHVFWLSNGRLRIFIRLASAFAEPALLANPLVTTILEAVHGPGYYCNFVSSDTALAGALLQSPHRQISFYDAYGYRPRGTIVNVPLTDCGLHNGPMEIWPGGSHLWRRTSIVKQSLRLYAQDVANPVVSDLASRMPSVMLEMSPGDLVLRDPGTLVRGTPNASGEPAAMLTAGYMREGESYPFGDPSYNLDEAAFEALSPPVRQVVEFMYRHKARERVMNG
jgi:ectoine hydroxylase-related dioxygenase (phytanoyl-CoA dioxygenase family)